MTKCHLKTTTCRKCGHIFGISAQRDISWVTACPNCIEAPIQPQENSGIGKEERRKEVERSFLGIDPGQKGGIAILHQEGVEALQIALYAKQKNGGKS